ncbi:MAG: TraR/DksA C4-type zinc finger protein [Patescibacteria group bacterium]|nr:TraR/DksA C4-type zinc finger protein [Patescibacteria group bacterium]
MQKTAMKKLEKKLTEQKTKLENQLNSFAVKSEIVENDWNAKMPSFDQGGGSLEDEADEVEEFGMRLALEGTMESELKKIDAALQKIKKGKYGLCEKCGKPIAQGRLDVYPQAEFCAKCQV